MYCQGCGVDAETKDVTFYQNIGALVMRFPSSISGRLCKSCVHKHFWNMTLITLILGWWGIISFCLTPFFLLNNIVRYLMCLGMQAVPEGAGAPELNEAVVNRLTPHLNELVQRLNSNEDFATVTTSIAQRAGVTSGQVALFVQALAKSQG
jgi:hypothetical protein